jgi:hypothetical protein
MLRLLEEVESEVPGDTTREHWAQFGSISNNAWRDRLLRAGGCGMEERRRCRRDVTAETLLLGWGARV